MPLLHRKTFVRTPLPADLDPSERLFHCRVTNEVFRDYDEFFERTILCNSLVWSCSFSGKSGLTYQEAIESERKIRKSLQNFPEPMAVPVLYLATLANHPKMSDLCEDIYDYVKDRFFVGETVTVVRNSGARLECSVLEIKAPPQENGVTNGHDLNNDTIIISDSDDDEPVPESWKKREPIDPTLFKYKVKPLVEAMYESVLVRQNQVSRKPALFSKERLKYFLKMQCETQNGIVKPKEGIISKYQILEKNYFHYFPDEPPRFEPSEKKRTPKENGLTRRQSLIAAQKEQERILQHRRELKAMELEKERMRRDRADRLKYRSGEMQSNIQQKEDIKRNAVVNKQEKEETRRSIKLERKQERVKIREEKRKYAEQLKSWRKLRDDMECDDLKELPEPTPVKTRLPPECFADALMVLEFLNAFGDLFDIQDEFPEGVTFELLERALVESDSEGPLCELMFFFLSAVFHAMAEEEEEVANDQITETEAKGLTEALGEDLDSANSALLAVASLAAAWPQLNHGCSLKELVLDSCTLSEILRLLILSSGADSNAGNAKYRYQKQGGFVATDDACMELRLSHPEILKKLSSISVYALPPGEKLKILHALCGRLLTLVTTRDYIEECVEELRQAKQEFRELKAEQSRKEREDAAARIRKQKEERLKAQEINVNDDQNKDVDKSDQNKDVAKDEQNKDVDKETEGQKQMEIIKDVSEQVEAPENEESTLPGKKRRGLKGSSRDSLGNKETISRDDELAKKNGMHEQELLEKIQQATSSTNIVPLGRDRWYRRFWTFISVPGLFVEEDYTGITEDMLQPCSTFSGEPNTFTVSDHTSPGQEEIKDDLQTSRQVLKPNRWCYYSTVEHLEKLIECLNPRGHRERLLKETLIQEKSRICLKLSNFNADRFHISGSTPAETIPDLKAPQTSAEKQLEHRLCELLLDIEDRIYQGCLGSIKVIDRQTWRTALEKNSFHLCADETKENGATKLEENNMEKMEIDCKQTIKDSLPGFKSEMSSSASTNTSTPRATSNSVRYLAQALLQIEQGVERKFLKVPLGDAEDKRKREDRKKKNIDQTNERDDINENGRVQRTLLDRWRESLLSSGSLSQVFLHLSTLDRSILWSRSILNFRCKVCRKKGDSENMLLCKTCERGNHIFCVRPKLKCIPDEAWLCQDCRPKKKRGRKPGPKKVPTDGDVEENVSDEQLQEGTENERMASSEDESMNKKNKVKLNQPLKSKGGNTPGKRDSGKIKSQRDTPKTSNGRGRGRGSGKKSYSAPPQEKKSGGHLSEDDTEAHEASLVELVSLQQQGKGRGRGKKIKSVCNTPVGSPFAFRPFSLENVDQKPKGKKRQSLTSTPEHAEATQKGRKRISEIASEPHGSRRSSGRHQGVHELSACEQLVVELVRHEDSWPFMKLVSKAQVPDYFEIIKNPIALNIIREKVNKCEYNSASEFIDDVQLMFFNCFEYNKLNSNEANAGLRLKSFFITEAEKLGLDISSSKTGTPAIPAKKSRI